MFLFSSPQQQRNLGFTIIEMMVALALFTIVITIATGAFLSLIGSSTELQGEQTVMSSLTFALDSMTREIRTGINYYCDDGSFRNTPLTATRDCASGANGISFVEAGSNPQQRISYMYNVSENTLERQIGDDDPESIVSSDTELVNAEFFVSGSAPLSNGDVTQPVVTVIIEARDPSDSTGKIHTLETTVDQRQLDI